MDGLADLTEMEYNIRIVVPTFSKDVSVGFSLDDLQTKILQ